MTRRNAIVASLSALVVVAAAGVVVWNAAVTSSARIADTTSSQSFFTAGEVSEFDHAANADVNRFNRFFHAMLENGVYLAPASYEAGFLSAAHTDADIEATVDAASNAFAAL